MIILPQFSKDEKTLPAEQRELNTDQMKVRNLIPSLLPYLRSFPFSLIQSLRVGKKIALQGLIQERLLQSHSYQ